MSTYTSHLRYARVRRRQMVRERGGRRQTQHPRVFPAAGLAEGFLYPSNVPRLHGLLETDVKQEEYIYINT